MGKGKLQLSDEEAERFSKIRLTHAFASLSLAAISKILPLAAAGTYLSSCRLDGKGT